MDDNDHIRMNDTQKREAHKERLQKQRELEYNRLNKQRLLVESVNPHTIFETDSFAEKGSVMSSMCFIDNSRAASFVNPKPKRRQNSNRESERSGTFQDPVAEQDDEDGVDTVENGDDDDDEDLLLQPAFDLNDTGCLDEREAARGFRLDDQYQDNRPLSSRIGNLDHDSDFDPEYRRPK